MNEYYTFNQLIESVNANSPVKIKKGGHPDHVGIVLSNKPLPVSINEHEFNFMKDFIIKHNLTNGVELATGTGVSTVAIGYGMSKTGGQLMSMDAYIEEQMQQQPIYTKNEACYQQSNCYKLANYMLQHFNLDKYVNLKVGMSPHDLIHEIKNLNARVDFVFLDCPKTNADYERDIKAISIFLAEKYAIFVHDTHGYRGSSVDDLNKKLFGKTFHKIHTYYKNTDHEITKRWPMALITNLE